MEKIQNIKDKETINNMEAWTQTNATLKGKNMEHCTQND